MQILWCRHTHIYKKNVESKKSGKDEKISSRKIVNLGVNNVDRERKVADRRAKKHFGWKEIKNQQHNNTDNKRKK